jgi:hypothetical protein
MKTIPFLGKIRKTQKATDQISVHGLMAIFPTILPYYLAKLFLFLPFYNKRISFAIDSMQGILSFSCLIYLFP